MVRKKQDDQNKAMKKSMAETKTRRLRKKAGAVVESSTSPRLPKGTLFELPLANPISSQSLHDIEPFTATLQQYIEFTPHEPLDLATQEMSGWFEI
mmetsp:Transcript_27084/g.67959  ORF Transcript_27084/g.67959 Transcript_27084/m.67959 type:complete len:96 (-) Transcript_27084:174-461(-)